MKSKELVLLAVTCAMIASPTPAFAAPLTPLNTLVALQGSVPDADVFDLSKLFGFVGGQTLNYSLSAPADFSGWSGNLTGSYLGLNVNVSYAGTITSNTAGLIGSWTSTGFYGQNTWSGNGTMVFTNSETIPQGLDYNFHSQLTVGAASTSFDSSDGIAVDDPGNGNDTTLTFLTFCPVPAICLKLTSDIKLHYFFDHIPKGAEIDSDLDIIIGSITVSQTTDKTNILFLVDGSAEGSGPISTVAEAVPEPTSFVLLCTGLLAVPFIRRRKG